jgi:hypothetical protein
MFWDRTLRLPKCAKDVDTNRTEQFATIDEPFVGHHGVKEEGMGGTVGWFRFNHSELIYQPACLFCQGM